jgi:(p)ppGpp synthase/HD superfamily hydrolase
VRVRDTKINDEGGSQMFDEPLVLRAITFFTTLHADQPRFRGAPPDRLYPPHLWNVGRIVAEAGGSMEAVIAAFGHDALNDKGHPGLIEQITSLFGDSPASLIARLSDDVAGPKGAKRPRDWKKRKTALIESIPGRPAEEQLIILAHNLDNLETLLADYAIERDRVWERYTAGRDGAIWYYNALADAFSDISGTSEFAGWIDRFIHLNGELFQLPG